MAVLNQQMFLRTKDQIQELTDQLTHETNEEEKSKLEKELENTVIDNAKYKAKYYDAMCSMFHSVYV